MKKTIILMLFLLVFAVAQLPYPVKDVAVKDTQVGEKIVINLEFDDSAFGMGIQPIAWLNCTRPGGVWKFVQVSAYTFEPFVIENSHTELAYQGFIPTDGKECVFNILVYNDGKNRVTVITNKFNLIEGD